jgi:glycine betaine/proline transport system permease protein
MSAAATDEQAPAEQDARDEGVVGMLLRMPAWAQLVAVLAVWFILWTVLRGNDTLALSGLTKTELHDWLTDQRNDLIASRDSNILMQITTTLGDLFNSLGEWLQHLVSQAPPGRPVPEIGWLGVLALATWTGYAVAGLRISLLVLFSFLAFGYLGYWEDSIDLLVVTFLSVGVCLLFGLPLAVWMASSKRATAAITPVLDVLQVLPSFIYLLPVVLFFGLGIPGAVAATVAYAAPPVIRIAAHGLRTVSKTALEATDSMGQTSRQRLLKVQLPMAKRTIIVGLNQTIMAALSMATIAAFINGPGLGKPVLSALQIRAVGEAFIAGICIVVMAIMLDRTTTAASQRSEKVARAGGHGTWHRMFLAGSGVAALVLVYVSHIYSWAAEFPESSIGDTAAERVQSASDWITSTFDGVTTGFKDLISYGLLNPMQDLLSDSPWWLSFVALVAIAFVLGGVRAAGAAVFCLAGIYATDLWYDAMVTLTMVLVGTLLVMALALVLGVLMARRQRVDVVLRPVLDAAQVMPPFVYLIPALLLFETTRFTAIVAAIIYAAPVAIKLVADGVSRVSPTTVEAAESSGATSWQMITKVQLPMARGDLVLAANQGMLYVLSMVVIGGLVGGGALGYDAVLGFSQGEFFGKALAAGGALVLMGILIDRVTQRAASKTGAHADQRSLRQARPATL